MNVLFQLSVFKISMLCFLLGMQINCRNAYTSSIPTAKLLMMLYQRC